MWLSDNEVYNPKQTVYDFSHADVPDKFREYIPLMERLERCEMVDVTDVPYEVQHFWSEYYYNLEPHVKDWHTHILLLDARPDGLKKRYQYLSGLPTKLSPSAHRNKIIGDIVELYLKIQIIVRTLIAPWIG